VNFISDFLVEKSAFEAFPSRFHNPLPKQQGRSEKGLMVGCSAFWVVGG
jgi:hypothetical protein